MFKSRRCMTNPALGAKRKAGIATTILPDGYVAVFCKDTCRAYTLPPIAGLAWEFFDGEHSEEEIVRKITTLMGENDASADLREQITKLSEELFKNGFLEHS